MTVKGFSRSKSLPVPQDYYILGLDLSSPILSCLVDQMKQDSELSKKYPDQATLLKSMIDDLDSKKISWPNRFSLMSSEEWIQKMRLNPMFYRYHIMNPSEMQVYEDLLLDLAAQCLKRKINLIPFLKQDEASIFTKMFSNLISIFSSHNLSSQPQFYIFACQKLGANNFFLSVLT